MKRMAYTPLNENSPDDARSSADSLTLGQLRVVEKALNGKVVDRTCELCKTDDWIVGHYLVTPVMIVVRPEGMSTDMSKVSPHVTISCKNCGNVKFLQLNYLGIDPFKDFGA